MNEENFNKNDPNRPSTSKENGQEDLDDQQLNDALENYAKAHNLTAQKVKNIIFHIVKNPNTFATLIRKDPEVMAGLRMTRSRLHQLEQITKRNIPPPELKPINAPRTFLDVYYGEEDEEDADYSPGNDKEMEEDKEEELTSSERSSELEEGNEEDENESNKIDEKMTAEEGKKTDKDKFEKQLHIVEEESPPNELANEEEHQFLTQVDNPIYPLFIRSVMGAEEELDPATREQLYNEDDDPEYMFQEFDGLCAEEDEEDEYEFRQDRATEIPRWELKALEQDFVNSDAANSSALDVPMESRPQSKLEVISCRRESAITHQMTIDIVGQCLGVLPQHHSPQPSFSTENALSAEGNDDRKYISSDGSCTLLAPADQIKFSEDELKALKVQMEKHVQLLCQCIAGSSPYPELVGIRNEAVQMLTDLSNASEARAQQPHSLFHIPNLLAAVYSAHDIEACQQVDLPLKLHNESHPSKETMWVLARSQACRYPELLPRHSFVFPSPNLPFLQSEQFLLAMALYQLRHVPHANQKNKLTKQKGKYPLIAEYFLPGRTLNQIKYHLRNIRSSPSPTLLHRIIGQAERGIFDVKYRPDFGETARDDIPLSWPADLQPFWLKGLADCFRRAQVEVTAMPLAVNNDENDDDEEVQLDMDFVVQQITTDVNEKMTNNLNENVQQTNCNRKRRRRRRDSSSGTAEAIANFGSAAVTSGQDETSNDQFPAPSTSSDHLSRPNPSVEITSTAQIEAEMAEPLSLQKKSRRKMRAERGMAALQSEEARDATMRSLIEAVYADFKQRMFMHQDKFRAIQSILLNPDLNTAERFSLLGDRLGQSHPQLFFLFAAIAPDDELPPTLRNHPDRLANKKALRMIHMIQTYMGGSRSVAHMKNTFKFLKEAKESLISEDRLFEALQRHFSIRDEPLWRLLRREWMGARCMDKVEDWQYECLDLDKLQSDQKAMDQACQYEQVKLPYRHDPTERSRLRVRHGRVTVELNGKLRNISVEYAPPNDREAAPTSSGDVQSDLPNDSEQIKKWSRQMDAALLVGYNNTGGDRQKCVDQFMASSLAESVGRIEVEDRLKSLMTMARQLHKKAHNQ